MIKKIISIICLIAIQLQIQSCKLRDEQEVGNAPPPLTIDTSNLEKQIEKLNKTTENLNNLSQKIDETKKKSVQKGVAAVQGIKVANKDNPPGTPKETVNQEAEVAEKSFEQAGFQAQYEDIIEMQKRVEAKLKGQVEQYEKLYQKVYEDLGKEKDLRVKLETEKEVVLKDKATEVGKLKDEINTLKQNSASNERGWELKYKRLQEEKDDIMRRKIQQDSAEDFLRNGKIAAILSAIFLLGAWLKKSPEMAAAGGICILGAGGYYSLANFVAQEWFMTISISFWVIIQALIIGFIAWFIYTHRKQVVAKAEKAAEDILNSQKLDALNEIHKAVEKAKLARPNAAKEVLEFIKDEMSPRSKAVIDKMKAAIHENNNV